MGLVELLIALIIIGAVIYVVGLLPIDETVKRIAYVAVIVAVAIWVLKHLPALGL